jgi:hypothetical protein
LTSVEYYGNNTTEDFEENIVNAFNIIPIIKEPISSYPLHGRIIIQAMRWAHYRCDFLNVRRWYIKENEFWEVGKQKFPVEFENGDNTVNPVRIKWTNPKTG